jgi:hypothetical protein
MFRWNGEEEREQPLYPLSLQNQIKCSFPVKYIGLFRQVSSPLQSLHYALTYRIVRGYVTSLSLEQWLDGMVP